MSKTIKDLEEFAAEKLGYDIVFQESISMEPQEVEHLITTDEKSVLVNSTYDDDKEITISMISTPHPEYRPIALIIQDMEGEVQRKELY